VHDVVGQVVVPAADEDLGAGDRVGTVLVAVRFCDDLSSSPKTTQCHTHTHTAIPNNNPVVSNFSVIYSKALDYSHPCVFLV
jgi:hypothetical protein